MIAEAGFLVRRIHEPRPTQEQVKRIPDLDDCYRLPYFLTSLYSTASSHDFDWPCEYGLHSPATRSSFDDRVLQFARQPGI